jgi:CDP-6-deoxy-D-xylo-4-hexulose-3-dehydrase
MQSSQYRVRLQGEIFGPQEEEAVLDCFRSGTFTMGRRVALFEQQFATYLGQRYGVMTNSGSSANLLLFSALLNLHRLKRGDVVVTPACTFATTVWPLLQVGLCPLVVDSLLDLGIDTDSLEEAFHRYDVKAVFAPHMMGGMFDVVTVKRLCEECGAIFLEDTCESYGARLGDKLAGSFGLASTVSFFYSHHISTIEGGMVLTSDEELADSVRCMRSFGWLRDVKNSQPILEKHRPIDPRFFFYTQGFNMRPTELAGALGLVQLPKLDANIARRREVAAIYTHYLSPFRAEVFLPNDHWGGRHVYLGYPVIFHRLSRDHFRQELEAAGIETRPIEAGNILRHPGAMDARDQGSLAVFECPQADKIYDDGIYVAVHGLLNDDDAHFVGQTMASSINRLLA